MILLSIQDIIKTRLKNINSVTTNIIIKFGRYVESHYDEILGVKLAINMQKGLANENNNMPDAELARN